MAPELEACARESTLRSGASSLATAVRFVNTHPFEVEIHWRDFEGGRTRYATLAPGQIRDQPTFEGHVWVATRSDGTCIALLIAGAAPITSTLGASAPVPTTPTDPGQTPVPAPTSAAKVGAPPAALAMPAFYQKHIDAGGLPIVSSGKVPDSALVAAREVVLHMLEGRADILARLIDARIRVSIMAESEVTIDIPEHSDLYQAFPGTDWNTRARGLGATRERPSSSAAEENILCYPQDRYRGESILVHEFAHTMYGIGVDGHQADFVKALGEAHASAIRRGLWSKTYAASNLDEYWAEGVQSWFDTNLSASPANGVHNEIDTRAELKTYDPELAKLLEQVYGDRAWRYSCPTP